MKEELILSLTNSFEDHSQKTENGIEYWFARDIQHLLGYTDWRNFEGVIKRATQLIINMQLSGSIKKVTKTVNIGSGAVRDIVDYNVDKEAYLLIKKLTSSQKLNNNFEIRNETVFLQLIQKYCNLKNIYFKYQFNLLNYRYDCIIGNNILVEFDEPHHYTSPKQKTIDIQKNKTAIDNGFKIFRIDLQKDIIDVIIFIQENISI